MKERLQQLWPNIKFAWRCMGDNLRIFGEMDEVRALKRAFRVFWWRLGDVFALIGRLLWAWFLNTRMVRSVKAWWQRTKKAVWELPQYQFLRRFSAKLKAHVWMRWLVLGGIAVLICLPWCVADTTAKTYTVHVYRMPKYEGIIPTMEIIDPNLPPEPPTYSVPMTVTLPLVGEMATTTALIIGAALLVIILLLVGFLLGRIGHSGGNDDYDDGGDDDNEPPQPPRPGRGEAPGRPVQQPVRRAEPVKAVPAPQPAQRASAPAAPVRKSASPAASQRKVSDDTLTSPFVEDLSGKMQQELAQRQAAEAARQAAEAEAARQAAETADPAAAADKKVSNMSLDELLNDIHNM